VKTTSNTVWIEFAFAGAICLFVPAFLAGQVAPGPTPGGPPAPSSQAPSQSQQADQMPPRQALSGAWKLNRDQSDDPEEKTKGKGEENASLGTAESPTSGEQSAPSGGGRRSGRAGSPRAGAGGGTSAGLPVPSGESDKDREKRVEGLLPAASLTIEQKEGEFDFTDDQGRKQVLYTNGQKPQKSKDNKYQEIAARWATGRLTYEEKNSRGAKVTRTFALSRDGRQLYETIVLDNSRIFSPTTIRYVYDPAPAITQP
jgi:hypothetical protein